MESESLRSISLFNSLKVALRTFETNEVAGYDYSKQSLAVDETDEFGGESIRSAWAYYKKARTSNRLSGEGIRKVEIAGDNFDVNEEVALTFVGEDGQGKQFVFQKLTEPGELSAAVGYRFALENCENPSEIDGPTDFLGVEWEGVVGADGIEAQVDNKKFQLVEEFQKLILKRIKKR